MKRKIKKIKVKFIYSETCFQIINMSVEARPEIGHIMSDLGAKSFEIIN